MKVLIFSNAYFPFEKEAEKAVREITARIKDVHFVMVTLNLNGKEKSYERIGNIDVYRVGKRKISKYFFPITGFIKALSLNNKYKFNVVWSIMANYAGLATLFYKITHPKIKMIVSLYEDLSISTIKRKTFFISPIFSLIFKKADQLYTTSKYLEDFGKKMGFSKNSSVMSSGFDHEIFNISISTEERDKFRESIGLKKEDIALLTTSRLIERNGIQDAIKSLSRLPRKFKLVICGEGDYDNVLKEIVKTHNLSKRVFFRGFVHHKDIPMYIKSCDIFVRPSISEIFGYSYLEAFAGKIPVVATKIGPISDILIDGKNGYVCKAEDYSSIATAVERAFEDKNKKEVVERAYSDSISRYMWKGLAVEMKKDLGVTLSVAVVGAGIFGSTTAINLARAGVKVVLFEKEDEILKAASMVNQYRLHRGYHYPRSLSTALSSKDAEITFLEEYGNVVLKDAVHYYCVSKRDSLVDAKAYIDFCDKCGLEHYHENCSVVNPESIQLSVRGREYLIDPIALRKDLIDKIKKTGVDLRLNTVFKNDSEFDYDFVINCSYASLNSIIQNEKNKRIYQFELCEKPIIELGPEFRGKSVVIMDGPFMCIDPYSDTNFHVMGNVVHAIHHTNTGYSPEIPDDFKPLINKGIISNPPITNIKKMIDSAKEYFPGIKNYRHVGSMYTIRTVLPNVESTDERPTLVSRVSENMINVFSGKIGNSVNASHYVLQLINSK